MLVTAITDIRDIENQVNQMDVTEMINRLKEINQEPRALYRINPPIYENLSPPAYAGRNSPQPFYRRGSFQGNNHSEYPFIRVQSTPNLFDEDNIRNALDKLLMVPEKIKLVFEDLGITTPNWTTDQYRKFVLRFLHQNTLTLTQFLRTQGKGLHPF